MSLVREMKRKRPKDLVREYLAWVERDATEGTRKELEFCGHWLYGFAYWLEGQDLWDEDIDRDNLSELKCRYHVIPAWQSPCPFGTTSERNELSAQNTKSATRKQEKN